jgi:hypothetical protein
MTSKRITPLQLELSEGPTELVRLYVKFAGPDGALRKGRVLAWDGPGCGYTVRILGQLEQVRGVQASKMLFLANQDEVDARPIPGTGRSGVLTGAVSKHGGRAPPLEVDGRSVSVLPVSLLKWFRSGVQIAYFIALR